VIGRLLAAVQARFEFSDEGDPLGFAQGKLSLRLKNGSAQDDTGQFVGEGFQSAAAANSRSIHWFGKSILL
jgi:hypothetical protein